MNNLTIYVATAMVALIAVQFFFPTALSALTSGAAYGAVKAILEQWAAKRKERKEARAKAREERGPRIRLLRRRRFDEVTTPVEPAAPVTPVEPAAPVEPSPVDPTVDAVPLPAYQPGHEPGRRQLRMDRRAERRLRRRGGR